MSTLLMTGFPGFVGSALLPRLLARRPGVQAVCLVQTQHVALARQRVATLTETHPHLKGRLQLVEGDITATDLGICAGADLGDVREVWHLAAVYDLAVESGVARRVNVDGTNNVLQFCTSRGSMPRLHHVSTCYVSGSHEGIFGEDDLDEGQVFRNHYESTKWEAEMAVHQAMADGLPATIYRPGIVVGDSTTGATQKYDGPYFLAAFLLRQLRLAAVPAVGDPDRVRVSLVPRDFVVDAMDELSVLDTSVGRTYALTDPDPPTVREVVDTFADHLGKWVVWVRLPLGVTRGLLATVPGMEWLVGFPAESVDYFASPTTYSTTNTRSDLEGSGVVCPPFADYAATLLEFMRTHPEIDSAAMV
ncbi:MAG: SDR family oxidoreductase [Humibacillus sp.]|nr:SDR family oxidoreductase [Humibacillus sp.]MDN5775917.1 SDR family oxidoreductase [Humibacillus sp.]